MGSARDRIPMWLASAITVCVSLPFGNWLGDYSLPLWVAFIVWAEYFVMGARPAALRIMVPAYLLGVGGATLIVTLHTVLARVLGDARLVSDADVAMFVSFFVGFCALLYAMKWMPVTLEGTLSFFNGISMLLGVFFTGAYERAIGPGADDLALPFVAATGAALAGLLGCFLAWFNVTILFPRDVAAGATSSAASGATSGAAPGGVLS